MAKGTRSEVAKRAEEMRIFKEALLSDREEKNRRFDRMDRRLDRMEGELGCLDRLEDQLLRVGDLVNLLVQMTDEGRYASPPTTDGFGQQRLNVHTRSSQAGFTRFDDTQPEGGMEEVKNTQVREDIIAVQLCSVKTFHQTPQVHNIIQPTLNKSVSVMATLNESMEAFYQTPKEHFETQTILKENVEEITTPLLRNQAHSIPSEGGSIAVPQSLLTNNHTHTPKYSISEGEKQSIWLEMKCVCLQSIKLEGRASHAMDPKCNSEQVRSSEVVFEIQWLLVVGSGLWLSKNFKMKSSLIGWKVVLQGDKNEASLMRLTENKVMKHTIFGLVEIFFPLRQFIKHVMSILHSSCYSKMLKRRKQRSQVITILSLCWTWGERKKMIRVCGEKKMC